ncbi:MAG: RHS repeat-associated core domain-containing protein, partial [Muribaculum sp.]|nr:RHS repeat-associated core domain-containing protein [Muribaculum sp.]
MTDEYGNKTQEIEYIPFGEVFLDRRSGDSWSTPYLFNGKEYDEETGLYYYGARYYDPRLSLWLSPDRYQEKYPNISTYAYAANSPVRYIDERGDSVAVLNLGSGLGHSALLIQREDGQWQYFSMNGTDIYENTDGLLGGKPYHDLGEKSFSSPQEFMESKYNRKANRETEVSENTVNNYGYAEAYVIPTSPEQDRKIAAEFRKHAGKGYNLLWRQCAQTVRRSLSSAGIRTSPPGYLQIGSILLTRESLYILPADVFRGIQQSNPNGQLILNRR